MSNSKFDKFQQICADLRLQTTNCQKSQVKFGEAKSVTEAVAALRMFWISVVEQIPAEFVSALDQHYAEFRDEMNAAGVYYNEAPANPTNAVVFVGDIQSTLSILNGRPRVIVLGRANVVVSDHVRCECYHEDAQIECCGHSRLQLKKGSAIARDYSTVEGYGTILTHDRATAYIYGGSLFDRGHNLIKSYNDAVIHSFTDRKIELYDQSQLKDIYE